MPDEAIKKPLTYEIERVGETVEVKCHGRLVAGLTDGFYADVKQALPGTKHLVLDLTDLTYVDSMGLGALARLYMSCRSAGCELKLINLGKQVRQLLSATNLLSVFSHAESHGINIA